MFLAIKPVRSWTSLGTGLQARLESYKVRYIDICQSFTARAIEQTEAEISWQGATIVPSNRHGLEADLQQKGVY